MGISLLTKQQRMFLDLFAENKYLTEKFYLTGGTALTEFYIPYRISDDLDFFSEEEVDTQGIISFLKKNQEKLGFTKYEFNTSFNRNLFFLDWPSYQLKTEFTYFPFTQIEKPQQKTLKVDSIIDIAVNKLFTIYQKPRSRDFIDLYKIIKKYKFALSELKSKARIKFDTNIDPIKLGSQMLLVTELKDYPKLVGPLNQNLWQDFFTKEAKNLKEEILSK